MNDPATRPVSPPDNWRFDHINVHAGSGAPLSRLFSDVMGLAEGYRPPFPFPGQWLYADDRAVVHAVHAPTQDETIRLGHIAFRTDAAADTVIARLRAAGLPYEVAVVPDVGDVQMFVSLPGGLVIELDAPADAAHPPAEYHSHPARTAG